MLCYVRKSIVDIKANKQKTIKIKQTPTPLAKYATSKYGLEDINTSSPKG